MRVMLQAACVISMLGSIVLAAPSTRPTTKPAIALPTTQMSDHVYGVLEKAVNSYAFRDASKRTAALAALPDLKSAPWPDLSKLQWVKIKLKGDPPRTGMAWSLQIPDGRRLVVLPDLTTRTFEPQEIESVELADIKADIDAILKQYKSRDSAERRPWDYTSFLNVDGGMPFYGGVYFLNQAVVAAQVGKDDAAVEFVHAALSAREEAISWEIDERAWHGLADGIAQLKAMRPRSEVLATWQKTFQQYPHSRYAKQFADLIAQLQIQVKEDVALASKPRQDPTKLPQAEQIAWYIARLSDVHGEQWSQPGMCQAIGMGEGTAYSDALVKIGRPAMPALIDQLEDRRLTRSIGFWRNFAPDRVVLRHQDVAIQCIMAITDIRFYERSSTSSYLSNEKPEIREKVIADIKDWWKQHGQETPLQGQLARLEIGRSYDRLTTLYKIEQIDPHAVDAVATIKRWATTAPVNELPSLANALAEHKDFSMLPKMRELALAALQPAGDGYPMSEAVWYLMRYGTTDDLADLRRQSRADLDAGVELGHYSVWGAIIGTAGSTTRPDAVPLFVDCLNQRKMTGSRYESGYKHSMSFSAADTAIETLIRLTGHDEGYKGDDEPEVRFAAIDRWKTWWRKEGEAAYLKAHPEIAPVIAVDHSPPATSPATKGSEE